MNNQIPQVWQIAAGESGRFYSDIFLNHDVMFLGPGRFGPYEAEIYRQAAQSGEAGTGIISSIASFHDDLQPGEIVLMREGHFVKAIGVIADAEYSWVECFDDVYGWDLQHTRRVIWQDHLGQDLTAMQTNGAIFGNRKQIPTFTRVNDESILDPLRPLFPTFKTRELRPWPSPLPAPMTLDDMGEQLFAKGVANDSVVKVIAAIERQRRLLGWYRRFGDDSARPTEHEVVAHTVLPLLMALGWSEQLLAVEWKKVDLAAFWGTPTTEEKCVLVCEAKTRRHGLQGVREQAFDYVTNLKLGGCRKVLLTDGGRFYLYARKSADAPWSDAAVGYLNVEKIRTNHIAPPGTNAIDTMISLTPAAAGRDIL